MDMPILTYIFFTFNWLTLTSEMHFVKFHPEVASCLLSRGKRKYAPLGMRLIWKYIRNYFPVYQTISHFLSYLQNDKELKAKILDLQPEKYGLSFDVKKCTTSGWALGDENVIGIRAFKWRLKFNSKSLSWCQFRQIFEVRAIEQQLKLIHMPPHQFWPWYHPDGLLPVHVRFETFSKQICNEALICHFYKNIKTFTQPHFPRDADRGPIYFCIGTIFYWHYKGLHQMPKDFVLCAQIPKYSLF